jgi:hypothetical protein
MHLFGVKSPLTVAARVVLTSAAAAGGMTLYGLLCGALLWAIDGPDGFTGATLGRFALAGAAAGALVGAGIAWDRAVNFGAAFDQPGDDVRRDSESPDGHLHAQRTTPIPFWPEARRHGRHGLNGGR